MDGRTHNISLIRYLYIISSFVLLFIWWKSKVAQNLIIWRLRVGVSLAWVKCDSQHELDQIKGTLSMFRDLCSSQPYTSSCVSCKYCWFATPTIFWQQNCYIDQSHLLVLTGRLCISVTTNHAAKSMCRICRKRVPSLKCYHHMISFLSPS